MFENQRPMPPPLGSWVYAVGILAAVVLMMVPVLDPSDLPQTNPFADYNQQRAHATLTDGSEHHAVLLGNSKLKYATRIRPISWTDSSGDRKRQASVLRIVNNNAEFTDLGNNIPEDIMNAAPDLIVIQGSMILIERSNGFFLRGLQQYARWRLFDRESIFELFEVDQEDLQFGTPCKNEFDIESLKRRIWQIERSGAYYSLEHANALAAKQYILDARQRGIAVAVLVLPNHPRLDAEVSHSNRDDLLRQLAQDNGAMLWRVPESVGINEDDYCDFIHMNEVGRGKLSDWLEKQMISAINQAST